MLEGRKKSGIPREDFLPETEKFLREAIARWLLGSEPFTARLNPDIGGYNDYDQLMRLDEWIGWLSADEALVPTPPSPLSPPPGPPSPPSPPGPPVLRIVR